MLLTLRQLQIFCAIAESGSTVAAALSVSLSQSATSAALKELERGLGVALFDRVGRRLLLNENGRALQPSARALLDGAKTVAEGFAPGRRGLQMDLRLAASTTIGNYLLPPLLAKFRLEQPNARLQLRIGNTLEVATAVATFEADLGLIEGPCHSPSLAVLPWLDDELAIIAAPTHPLSRVAASAKLTIRQLQRARWLLREPGSGTREAVEHALLPHLHHLSEDMTLGSSEAIKNTVALGVGISCMSRAVVADLVEAGRLVELRTTLPRLHRRLALVHHSQKILSASLRRFAAMLDSAAAATDGAALIKERGRTRR